MLAVTITTESNHRSSVFLGELCICVLYLAHARTVIGPREYITIRLLPFNFVPFDVDVKCTESFFRIRNCLCLIENKKLS